MSLLSSTFEPTLNCSGAMYKGVPTTEVLAPATEALSILAELVGDRIARPKSVIFMLPIASIIKLLGLRSRCAIKPFERAWIIPSQISRLHFTACGIVGGAIRI